MQATHKCVTVLGSSLFCSGLSAAHPAGMEQGFAGPSRVQADMFLRLPCPIQVSSESACGMMVLVQVVWGGLWEPCSKQDISLFLFQQMCRSSGEINQLQKDYPWGLVFS